MASDTSKELGEGWSRSQLSLRLTPQRKASLLSLSEQLDGATTPTDALDRAIELAREFQRLGSVAGRADIEDIEAALDLRAAEVHERLDRQESRIDQLHESLRGLHRLISTIADTADTDGFAMPNSEDREPISFRTWLEGSIERAGMKALRAAIVRSTWQAKSASTSRMIALDLMAELVAVDGVAVASRSAYPELARIALIDASHPLARIESPRPIFLVCQVVGQGWVAHAHHADQDGKPGSAIGTHRT